MKTLAAIVLLFWANLSLAQRTPVYEAQPVSDQLERTRLKTILKGEPHLPGIQSPVAPGTYRYLYRNAFWNTATNQWRADSLRVQGQQVWAQTPSGLRIQYEHLAGHNYQTGDTSYSRYTYWGEGPYGYTDTLNRIFRTVGSSTVLREYLRDVVRAIPGGYMRVEMDYVNGLDSSDITYYYLDALGRLTHYVHYGYGGLPVRRDSIPMVDSNFYQGNSPYPYKERLYSSLPVSDAPGSRRVLALSNHTDSIQYDAQGRRLYEASISYYYGGRSTGRSNTRTTYNGRDNESITKIYGLTNANPPQPRPLVARRSTSTYFGDSIKHYFYNWNGTAFQLDYRRTVFYPTPGRSLLDFTEIRGTTDSLKNGAWKPYLSNENHFVYGTGGEAKALYMSSKRYTAFTSMERKSLEFYTPGLLPAQPTATGKALTIAPNPAGNQLTINSEHPIDRLILTDALGRQHTVSVESGRASIAHLPPGLYHATALGQGKVVGISRVVKE